MIIYRCDSLDADNADDADSFSLVTDYPLLKIIDQRHLRLKSGCIPLHYIWIKLNQF